MGGRPLHEPSPWSLPLARTVFAKLLRILCCYLFSSLFLLPSSIGTRAGAYACHPHGWVVAPSVSISSLSSLFLPRTRCTGRSLVPNTTGLTRTDHAWFLASHIQVPKGLTSHVSRSLTVGPLSSRPLGPLNPSLLIDYQ